MKANAALGYLLVSCSLLARGRVRSGTRSSRVVQVAALLVVLIGAATLFEYVFSVRLGIDRLLFADRVAAHVPYPGRPAANEALGLCLLGGALLGWDLRVRRVWAANVLAWAATIVGLLALAGYLTGADSLISLGARQHIALNSTFALCALSIGFLLARADRGEMRLLASRGQEGVVLRRLLAIAIGLPVFLAAGTLAGRRLGLFSIDAGAWLVMSATLFALIRFSWIVARAAEHAHKATAELRADRRDLRRGDLHAHGQRRDPQLEHRRATPLRPHAGGGDRTAGHDPQHRRGRENREHVDAALSGAAVRFESADQTRDGGCVHVAASLSPISGPDGEITAVACVARDITDLVHRTRLEDALREVALAAANGETETEAVFDLVAARVADLLDAPAAGVVRFDRPSLTVLGWAGPSPRPARLSRDGPSSTTEVARTGQTATSAGYEPSAGDVSAFVASQGMRFGISTPVYLRGELWGCLSVTTDKADGFTARDGECLEHFANLTAAALAIADAHAELRDEARVERAMRRVARASAEGRLDERGLADLAAGQIKSCSIVRWVRSSDSKVRSRRRSSVTPASLPSRPCLTPRTRAPCRRPSRARDRTPALMITVRSTASSRGWRAPTASPARSRCRSASTGLYGAAWLR